MKRREKKHVYRESCPVWKCHRGISRDVADSSFFSVIRRKKMDSLFLMQEETDQ